VESKPFGIATSFSGRCPFCAAFLQKVGHDDDPATATAHRPAIQIHNEAHFHPGQTENGSTAPWMVVTRRNRRIGQRLGGRYIGQVAVCVHQIDAGFRDDLAQATNGLPIVLNRRGI
jgi:hypothetical protein